MKSAKKVRARRSGLNLQTHLYSLSAAKTYLGRLIEKAGRGEQVYIVKGHRRFALQPAPEIEPVPMRPAGYFAELYNQAEIAEENHLAKSSVIRPPKDLE